MVKNMNTADLCSEGRDLYVYYALWKGKRWSTGLVKYDAPRKDAYQKYQEHIRECPFCKEE